MRIVKNFEYFIKVKIVKTQKVDLSRTNFLINESKKSYGFLKEMINTFGINEKNSSTIVKTCYDIIMELTRAIMLKNGLNSSGRGAHEAEISYLRKVGLSETDVQFADSLRYLRNGILYYGKKFDEEYAKKTFDFLNKIYPKLRILK